MCSKERYQAWHDDMSLLKTKPTKWPVCPAKTQISLGIRPLWSESLLSAWWKVESLATHKAHSEDSDQTRWRTDHFVGFVMRRLICWFRRLTKLKLYENMSNWPLLLIVHNEGPIETWLRDGKFLKLSLVLHHQTCQMLWWIWELTSAKINIFTRNYKLTNGIFGRCIFTIKLTK